MQCAVFLAALLLIGSFKGCALFLPSVSTRTRYVCQRERRSLPSQYTKYKTNEVGDFFPRLWSPAG